MLALAAFKFFLATLWAGLEGHSLSYVLQQWFAGPQVGQEYSGTLLKAVHDIDGAFISLMAIVLIVSLAVAMRRQYQHSTAIIEELRQHGAW